MELHSTIIQYQGGATLEICLINKNSSAAGDLVIVKNTANGKMTLIPIGQQSG